MSLVTDASVLINLRNGGALELCLASSNVPVLVGSIVLNECDDGVRAILEQCNPHWQLIDETRVNGEVFSELLKNQRIGLGEAECIALCMEDDTTCFACDDKSARRLAGSRIGKHRLTGSLGLLRSLVHGATMDAAQAHRAYLDMVAMGGFLPQVRPDYWTK